MRAASNRTVPTTAPSTVWARLASGRVCWISHAASLVGGAGVAVERLGVDVPAQAAPDGQDEDSDEGQAAPVRPDRQEHEALVEELSWCRQRS